MNRIARIVAVAYTLAILLAALGPHCDWMFPNAQAATAQLASMHHGENHADHHEPAKKSDRDCAAMEMAKSIGPVPAALTVATPDISIAAAVLPAPPLFNAPAIIDAVQPRGPPRTSGGFAAVFASNHRLLI